MQLGKDLGVRIPPWIQEIAEEANGMELNDNHH